MFLEFSVGNYLSFKDIVTLSMVAGKSVKELEDEGNQSNVFFTPENNHKVLKSAVLYGANNSGKSNLISAMSFFRGFILASSNEKNATDEIKVSPFLLNTATENQPSFFEIIFYINTTCYRYGFEADKNIIHNEWLYEYDKAVSTKEHNLFERNFQKIKISNKYFKEGKGKENATRPNALFLSLVAQLNGEKATEIQEWISENFNILSGLNETTTHFTVKQFIENTRYKSSIIDFLKKIKIGFEDIEVNEITDLMKETIMQIPDEFADELNDVLAALKKLKGKIETDKKSNNISKDVSINFLYKKYDEAENYVYNQIVDFGLQSKGTHKIFALLGPILDTIENNKILIIDELDSSLHTLLTIEIVKLFHAKGNSAAQLIFASHDTNLLRKSLFRRDQIWFAEKNKLEASDLYSLVEYKIDQANSVRNDASFEKDYLLGKYGAIPFFGDLTTFINDFTNAEAEV
jgi:AAA15 family ATPase/GTPase